jgi:hypothetical protein
MFLGVYKSAKKSKKGQKRVILGKISSGSYGRTFGPKMGHFFIAFYSVFYVIKSDEILRSFFKLSMISMTLML